VDFVEAKNEKSGLDQVVDLADGRYLEALAKLKLRGIAPKRYLYRRKCV